MEGEEDTPRYTEAEVTKLGEEGKAYKRRNGTYSFPIKDRRDLLNGSKRGTVPHHPKPRQ